MAKVTLGISVMIAKHKLVLTEKIGTTTTVLLEANIVSGCSGFATPSGIYKGGKWIKDKTNTTHGPKPWIKRSLGKSLGPYFLPLNDAKSGKYTTYGIHGTRGPLIGGFEKPPVPEGLLRFFVSDDDSTNICTVRTGVSECQIRTSPSYTK